MRGVLIRLLYLVAASSALAASAGVAVPAHEEEPGAPPFHEHVLGAYRYGFLLPAEMISTLSPTMARLHEALMTAGVPMEIISQMPGMGARDTAAALPTIKTAVLSPI